MLFARRCVYSLWGRRGVLRARLLVLGAARRWRVRGAARSRCARAWLVAFRLLAPFSWCLCAARLAAFCFSPAFVCITCFVLLSQEAASVRGAKEKGYGKDKKEQKDKKQKQEGRTRRGALNRLEMLGLEKDGP